MSSRKDIYYLVTHFTISKAIFIAMKAVWTFLYHFKPLAKFHIGSYPGVQSSDMEIQPLSVVFPEVPTITLDLKIMSKRREALHDSRVLFQTQSHTDSLAFQPGLITSYLYSWPVPWSPRKNRYTICSCKIKDLHTSEISYQVLDESKPSYEASEIYIFSE